MRVYNCNGSQYALDAVVPLGLALAWYEGYIPVCTKRSARLLQNKLCRAIPSGQPKMLYHTAKVRRLQTQTCEELEQSKVALPEIHWQEDSPAQPLVERDGLRVCAVQWAERLH